MVVRRCLSCLMLSVYIPSIIKKGAIIKTWGIYKNIRCGIEGAQKSQSFIFNWHFLQLILKYF